MDSWQDAKHILSGCFSSWVVLGHSSVCDFHGSQGAARGKRVLSLLTSLLGEDDWFHQMRRVTVKVEAVVMRVNTSKSEAMVLFRRTVDC